MRKWGGEGFSLKQRPASETTPLVMVGCLNAETPPAVWEESQSALAQISQVIHIFVGIVLTCAKNRLCWGKLWGKVVCSR